MNDKWESSIWLMNADGTHQRALVARARTCTGRRTASASRTSAKGEPNGSADLRALDGRRGRDDADLARDGRAVEPRVVARRQVDRVHDERAGARHWRIAMPTPPKGAKWTEAPKVVTRLNYRSDRVGYTDESYRHIFVIPADGGTPRQITNGDWNALGARRSRRTASGSRSRRCASRTPRTRSGSRRSTPRTSRPARSSSSRSRNGTNGSPIVFARRQADRLHVRRFRRPLGVGGDEAVGDERRRIERARRLGQPRPSDLGRRCGRTTTPACTSTSRAKVQRTCISRRRPASSTR